jgi:hypothetical protein
LIDVKGMLIATALAAAIAGCGSVPTPGGGATANVSGTVVASPCRPVERAGDPPCPAVGNVTVEFGSARAMTNSSGVYALPLAPGTYQIRVKAGDWERPATPASVSLTAGAAIKLDLTYDSGIR